VALLTCFVCCPPPPPSPQVLAKVEEANQVGRKLPPDGFYNQLIRSAGGHEGGGVLAA